ncbi:YesL family protein [Fictibacillus fluitans]|uniref:YesL family protein n=1 Tax=Fictibacillus fluitans TaxID=3058422 RepID=A0ABT8HWC1_9BACL|nr:YesL family protein [Fictibacillus sp. NE201]MDN4525023.1 YesL family protein [Fictibacillus sp. NE201]
MQKRKEFGTGFLYVLMNHIYALMLTNICFILSNVIFLFFFMTLEPSFTNITLYFLALIPAGPSISALFYSIGKLIREQELSPLRDYLHGYKINVKDTLKFWTPYLMVLYILFIDFQYYNTNLSFKNSVLSVVILAGIALLMVVSLNAFFINSGFSFRTRDVWRLSIYYGFKKPKITFGNAGIVIIALFMTMVTNSFFMVFTASLITYLFMLNSKTLLEDLKENFCKQETISHQEVAVSK